MSDSAAQMSDPAEGPAPSGGDGRGLASFKWRHTHKLDGQKRVAFPRGLASKGSHD